MRGVLQLVVTGLLGASLWLGACSKERDVEERRRELLRPKDRLQARRAILDKLRFKGPDGALLESDEVVAGLTLPRGLTLVRAFEREWYYRAEHREITLKQLEDFFAPHLFTSELRRDKTGTVWFVDAQLKDDPKAPPVSVRISRPASGVVLNEVYIKQAAPKRTDFPSREEAEAKLRARRQYAD